MFSYKTPVISIISRGPVMYYLNNMFKSAVSFLHECIGTLIGDNLLIINVGGYDLVHESLLKYNYV